MKKKDIWGSAPTPGFVGWGFSKMQKWLLIITWSILVIGIFVLLIVKFGG